MASIVTTLHTYVFSHEGMLYRFSREVEQVGRVQGGWPKCYLACETGFKMEVDDDSLASIRAGVEDLRKRLPV